MMRSPALAPIFAVGGIGPKNQGSISKWRSSFEGSIGRVEIRQGAGAIASLGTNVKVLYSTVLTAMK